MNRQNADEYNNLLSGVLTQYTRLYLQDCTFKTVLYPLGEKVCPRGRNDLLRSSSDSNV